MLPVPSPAQLILGGFSTISILKACHSFAIVIKFTKQIALSEMIHASSRFYITFKKYSNMDVFVKSMSI